MFWCVGFFVLFCFVCVLVISCGFNTANKYIVIVSTDTAIVFCRRLTNATKAHAECDCVSSVGICF